MNDFEEVKQSFDRVGVKYFIEETERCSVIKIYGGNYWAPEFSCAFNFDKNTKKYINFEARNI
jgi:hypothetical protein